MNAENSQPTSNRISPTLRLRLLCCLLALSAVGPPLPAQTLARPGWAGSGLTVDRWWKHAVILDLPTASDLPLTIEHLDTLRTLGVDAILLHGIVPLVPPNPTTLPNSTSSLDDLLREASRRNLRVLLELPANQPAANLAAAARSWAARGAAGFLIPNAGPDALRTVRSALRAIPGERILISAPADASPPTSPNRQTPANAFAELELIPLTGLTSSSEPTRLRATLAVLPAAPLLTTEDPVTPTTNASLKLALNLQRVNAAAVLLLTPGASLLQQSWLSTGYDPPFAANSLAAPPAAPTHTTADQLQQFTALHHDRPAFRDGPTTLLDHTPEGAVVWLRRGPAGSTFVVACNLRATSLRLSLTDDLARLHLRGAFLRTLSRSDPGLGAMPLNAVTLPPFGVYVGELSR